jgi:hypothetical protein
MEVYLLRNWAATGCTDCMFVLFLVIHGMLQHVVLVLPYVLLFAPFANFEFLSKMMME